MRIPSQIQNLIQPGQQVRIFKSGPAAQMYLAQSLVAKGQNVVVVLPSDTDLPLYSALAALFSGAQKTGPLWTQPWLALPQNLPQEAKGSLWPQRWAALYGLMHKAQARGVLLSVDNFINKWPSPEVLYTAHLSLTLGEEINQEDLLTTLVHWGYERVSMVTSVGELSVRGDIVDIFCPGYDLPLRFEFFGDSLERLRLFEPLSQRSRNDLETVVILPVTACIQAAPYQEQAQHMYDQWARLGEISSSTRASLEHQLLDKSTSLPPSVYYAQTVSIEAWLPQDSVLIMVEAQDLRSKLEEASWAWQNYFGDPARQWPRHGLVQSVAKVQDEWSTKAQVLCETLVMGVRAQGFDLPEESVDSFQDLFWTPESRTRPWRALLEALDQWPSDYTQTLLCFRTQQSRRKFLHLAAQEGHDLKTEYAQSQRGIFALVSFLGRGMRLPWAGIQILPESVLQPESTPSHASARKAFKGLDSFDDLVPGDLLVHRDYGLCRFDGLHGLQIGDVRNDFLLLLYDGQDKLYLPVDRLALVQRYKGPEGAVPALDRLGGSAWIRARDRARQAIAKIAQDLVEMYAFRKVTKGFSYKPISELYWEFEASFGFEETPDQEKAIQEVLADMEKPEPMDRLVCGDVGFGKTEVALRAAFRAVIDGKQVALLCPTTVLAEQHFQTFRQRMEPFSISVGLLSRFVPPARQKTTLAAVKKGHLDILIGTHRMLSKDVHFANLTLLILDEEQRFGVQHKERIKKMRSTIDVLTLTATPIPRTLQLSLSGIRGLSVIETPPLDRKPVETSLMERDAEQLQAILERELARGGQVFWVYNRVRGLEQVRNFVSTLVPQARVGMGHGQMKARELEETMHQFWHGQLDILVCTAIIESGLDFPRANTLIVDQAHLFGLGQLYQLRGRVGRSSVQAYAYFVIPNLEHLQETARQRLKIILDMDYLGAGFKVAMEDLRLRGAGNILGEAQSGSIGKVGLDLFLEMLEEEVQRLRGGEVEPRVEPELNLGFPALIPEAYLPDSQERLRYYKAFSSCQDVDCLQELVEDVRDRFGVLPAEFETFVAVLLIKLAVRELGAVRVDLAKDKAIIYWNAARHKLDLEKLILWVSQREQEARILPPAQLELKISESENLARALEKLRTILHELQDQILGSTN